MDEVVEFDSPEEERTYQAMRAALVNHLQASGLPLYTVWSVPLQLLADVCGLFDAWVQQSPTMVIDDQGIEQDLDGIVRHHCRWLKIHTRARQWRPSLPVEPGPVEQRPAPEAVTRLRLTLCEVLPALLNGANAEYRLALPAILRVCLALAADMISTCAYHWRDDTPEEVDALIDTAIARDLRGELMRQRARRGGSEAY